jgi:hypothetical protein
MEISLNYKTNAMEFNLDRYSVTVFRGSQSILFEVETSDEKTKKRGCSVSLPVEAANRLGHALVLMLSGKEAGVPDTITFKVGEPAHEI